MLFLKTTKEIAKKGKKTPKNPKIAQNSLKIALFNALFNFLLTDGGG
jgi:hypothetical protein